LYSFLRSHKVKVLEVFGKMDRGESQRITREEFIMALKAVSVLLWLPPPLQDRRCPHPSTSQLLIS
jgi:hypothetical protein